MKVLYVAILLIPACLLFAEEPFRINEVNAYLESQFEKSAYPGLAVVLVHKDKVLLSRGFGVEKMGESKPMTIHSSSAIGSLTKSFTALALMRLVEEGRIDLDQPVITWLPWFQTARKSESDKITLRMLLSNSSGLPSQDIGMLGMDTSDLADRRFVEALSSYVLNRQPGTTFEYSNEGFTTAGLIGAEITGLPYHEFMKTYVLDPLAMTRSTTNPKQLKALNVLNGHFPGLEQGIPAQQALVTMKYAAAGSIMRCTAHDMGRYLGVLLNDGVLDGKRILSSQTIETLWSPQIALPEDPVRNWGHYALGWMNSEVEGRKVIHHGGNAMTMSSFAMLEPDRGTGIAILSNIDSLDRYHSTSLYALANNALHTLHGEPHGTFGMPQDPDSTLNAYKLPEDQRARFIGVYASGGLGNSRLIIEETERGLEVKAFEGQKLIHHGLADFMSPVRAVSRSITAPSYLRFKATLDGQVYGVNFSGESLYKRRDKRQTSSFKAPDGSISFSLASGWEGSWQEGSFHLKRQDHIFWGGMLPIEEDPEKPWLRNGESLIHEGAELGQTISGRFWLTRGFYTEYQGTTRQKHVFKTEVNGRTFYVVLDTPEGDLTDGLQETAMDFLQTLDIRSSKL